MSAVGRLVRIPVAGGMEAEGALAVPAGAQGVVLFAHGSGSSRHSPRNRFVAEALNAAGFATLLLDLLTPEEDADIERRFDIGLLAARLLLASRWLAAEPIIGNLKLDYFGASTGAAAALVAAAALGEAVAAVVSRGGRPDLAGSNHLKQVRAPTLLIVGSLDYGVIELNREAFAHLACRKEMVLVPGATHLFEEPGTLEQAAEHAIRWFRQYLD